MRIRSIVKPYKEGKNVTLAEARSAFRELSRDATPLVLRRKLEGQRFGSRPKSTPKAG